MEILVFLIPVASMVKKIIERAVFAEKSATADIEEINECGMKGHFLRSPFLVLSLPSLVASYWYIGVGWLWAGVGLAAIAGLVLFMVIPSQPVVMPNVGSVEYFKLIRKRRKQAGIQAAILVAWVLSWAIT